MLNHSIVLKFNNVEMLKSLWKMLKTPAAGTCAKRQNCLRQPCQFAQKKNVDKAKTRHYNKSSNKKGERRAA